MRWVCFTSVFSACVVALCWFRVVFVLKNRTVCCCRLLLYVAVVFVIFVVFVVYAAVVGWCCWLLLVVIGC